MHLRAVCKPRRQNESDHSADQKRQDRAKQCYAARLCARIPDEKICHQGRNAGGKQKDIALRVELYLTDKAADQHTCKAEPDIQHRNAPEAEARRQEIGKHRNAVRLAAGKRQLYILAIRSPRRQRRRLPHSKMYRQSRRLPRQNSCWPTDTAAYTAAAFLRPSAPGRAWQLPQADRPQQTARKKAGSPVPAA